MHNALTDVPGFQVGQAQDEQALTGCTVVLCPPHTVGGVDQRGGAPGTRETDLLRPMHLVSEVHAVLLSGGSAFGLDAAGGVMRYLEEHGQGFDVGVARVPIVPAAVLFDLGTGRADVRPGPQMGYQACLNASGGPIAAGNVGAGMGATVGKILGPDLAMKGGLGSASIALGGRVEIGALAAVNAWGDVIDPASGAIIAGARNPQSEDLQPGDPGYFADTLQVMHRYAGEHDSSPTSQAAPNTATVIGVVATNARLDKAGANKLAQMAHDGLARAIRPAHTLFDGDTIFALASGEVQVDLSTLGAFAAEVMTQAILHAIRSAKPLAGLPAAGQPAGKLA